MPISTSDEARFAADGYLHLRGGLEAATVDALTTAIGSAQERDPGPNPLTLDTMRFASNLFYDSEVLQAFLSGPTVADLTRRLLADDAWVRWDQAVWKGPGAPEFPWHQDNGYTGLAVTHLQIWVALTRSDGDNGGLVVEPGGHRRVHEHRWVGHHVAIDEPPTRTVIVAEPGDVVVFSSLLPHSTTPNVTRSTRLAYVAELLPVSHADRSVRPPHFVAVEHGRGSGRFADLSPVWDA